MTAEVLARNLEAILFVAAEPLQPTALARLLDVPAEDIAGALDKLATDYQQRGLRLALTPDGYELVTHPDARTAVNAFLGSQTKADLSKPALETLAIIAWRQPITKAAIETLRGVASDQSLKNLLVRGLIAEAEPSKEPGRPLQYRTTTQFLRIFGLQSPADLPPLDGPIATENTTSAEDAG